MTTQAFISSGISSICRRCNVPIAVKHAAWPHQKHKYNLHDGASHGNENKLAAGPSYPYENTLAAVPYSWLRSHLL